MDPHCDACPLKPDEWCVSAEHPRSCELAQQDRAKLAESSTHDAHWLRSIAAKSRKGNSGAVLAAAGDFAEWDYIRTTNAALADASAALDIVDFDDAVRSCPSRGKEVGDYAPCVRYRKAVTLEDCRHCLIAGEAGEPFDG